MKTFRKNGQKGPYKFEKILVPSECTNLQTLQLSLKLKYRATNTLQEGLKQGFKRKLLLGAPNSR